MTPSQCKAGRALIGITQDDLAARAGIARMSLCLFEAGGRKMHPRRLQIVRAEIERAGVEMIDGDRPGVRMASVQKAAA